LIARIVAVIRQASSRSSKTSSGSASSSRTLIHADEFVARPTSYTAGVRPHPSRVTLLDDEAPAGATLHRQVNRLAIKAGQPSTERLPVSRRYSATLKRRMTSCPPRRA